MFNVTVSYVSQASNHTGSIVSISLAATMPCCVLCCAVLCLAKAVLGASAGKAAGTAQATRTAPTFDEEYEEDDMPAGRTSAASTAAAAAGSAASQAAKPKAQQQFATSGYADELSDQSGARLSASNIGEAYWYHMTISGCDSVKKCFVPQNTRPCRHSAAPSQTHAYVHKTATVYMPPQGTCCC